MTTDTQQARGASTGPGDGVEVAWRDVSKVYPDGYAAVREVTLEVRSGELLAILGTSGSGKTTLLKLVNRLIDPTSGEVQVSGRATSDWDPIALRRSVGYVIQEAGLMPHMSVIENASLVCRLKGDAPTSWRVKAVQALKMVGLDVDRLGDRMPHQLSGGQRQRVGVARALASDPRLILMDEPFGALDPITRLALQDEFRQIQRSTGKTVILVTHDIREACRMADRLALMDGGRLRQVGTPSELVDRPADDFVRSFFAEARAVAPISGSPEVAR